jgi:predicted transcriptional regulator
VTRYQHGKPGKPTAAEIKRMREKHDYGVSLEDIAKIYGRSAQTVRNYLTKERQASLKNVKRS